MVSSLGGEHHHDVVSLLTMLQLGDAFFPSGLYTLSHGLESLVQTGRVTGQDSLEAMLEDYVTEVVATSEAVAASASLRAAAVGDIVSLVAIDQELLSLKLAREPAVTSLRTGRGLLSLMGQLTAGGAAQSYGAQVKAGNAPGCYPVCLGVLGAAWGLDAEQIALVDLYSFVSGLLGAALRCLRLDHAQAQASLHRLLPLLATAAREAAATPYEEMRAFAPAIEIAQMWHERAEVRLFAS